MKYCCLNHAVVLLLVYVVNCQQYFPSTITTNDNTDNYRRIPQQYNGGNDDNMQVIQQLQQQQQQRQYYPTTTSTAALNQCPRLESPYNGYVMMTGLYHGATAYYTCQHHGYQPMPSSVRYCMFGSWTGAKPTCESPQMIRTQQQHIRPTAPVVRLRRVCPSLLPPHNGFVTILASNGGTNYTAMYRCFTGFSLHPASNELRHCQSNGLWSGVTPSCERVPSQCAEPGIPMNGACKLNSTLEGGILTCQCCEMCKMIGSNVRMCMSNGKWSGMQPVCIQNVECPPLRNLTSGKVMYTSVGAGAVATYSCNDDFYLTGNTLRICQADGQWSGYEPSCRVTDIDLSVNKIASNEYVKPEPAVVSCEAPYPPENGYVIVINETAPPTVEYICNQGYDLEGVKTRICQDDGTWSEKIPICQKTRVVCEAPSSPEHGHVRVVDSNTTSTAVYRCNKGYDLRGASTRVCLSDGTWSESMPICHEISCGDLSDPDNGKVYYTETGLHAVALYRCSRRYRMIGEMRRVCEDNYKWSGSAPRCQMMQIVSNRFFCPRLSPPKNAIVKMTGVIIGSKAKYTCRSQLYRLIGDEVRVCSRNGEWSGEEPQCVMAGPPRVAYAIDVEDIFTEDHYEGEADYTTRDRSHSSSRDSSRGSSRDRSYNDRQPQRLREDYD